MMVCGAGAAGAVIAKLLMGQEVDPDVSVPVKDVVFCDSRGPFTRARRGRATWVARVKMISRGRRPGGFGG